MSVAAATSERARVYVETYGCAFNVSDGEVMAGLLARDGFELVGSASEADAVVVNSCTVKDRTYLELEKRVRDLSATGVDRAPAVILAGCAPRVQQQSARFANHSQIGPDNLAALPGVVRRTLAGERVIRLEREHDEARLLMPVRRRNPAVEIIPISKGCLGSCTFCQTVIARGRLRSFSEEQIIARVLQAVAEGVTQVWLTSQDCGAYGLDCGTNLPRLLRRIARVSGDFKVRVGMANPDLIKLYLPEFAAVLSDEKFYTFAHIPVQAGSDTVLRDMRRLYTRDDFMRICDALRQSVPKVTIATDIIVGFPTESDEDFEATLDLLQQTELPVVNRSKFSPRVGTSAARLRPLPKKMVAERSKRLLETCSAISAEKLGQWIGWRGSVIVEERTASGACIGRNFAYLPVVLNAEASAGARLDVEITAVEGFHLVGQCNQLAEAR